MEKRPMAEMKTFSHKIHWPKSKPKVEKNLALAEGLGNKLLTGSVTHFLFKQIFKQKSKKIH